MTITVDLSPEEVAEIRRLTRQTDDAEAVSSAAREFVRLRQLRELKAVSGKVDFKEAWRDVETVDIRDPE